MRRCIHVSIVVVLVVTGTALLSAVPAGAGRGEVILSWDDGAAEGSTSGLAGQRMAVRFQAPPGNCGLLGMLFYSADDGLENPTDPELPTTRPFTAWVWRVGSEGQPGPAANLGYWPFEEYGYPEDAWVEVVFPEPVDLSDPAQFPDGWFFVGIELEYRNSPYVGLDLDPPISGESWFWNWAEWGASDTANLMIRAVVCDSTASPIELKSWGGVKQSYR